MDSIQTPDKRFTKRQTGEESGIALFMVIAAMTVLSVLVTEFTYVAQVNQRMAYDGLDQLKAHYLAKTGFKLSLLRLKAYQQIKALMGGGDGNGSSGEAKAGAPGIPKQLIDKIWSFPFFYPIPTNVPGLSPAEKERITAFEKSSGLSGKFSAVIESESSKLNLNMILAPFSVQPSPNPSSSPSPSPEATAPATGGTPEASVFKPEAARESLATFFEQILNSKFQSDPAFAKEYSDFRLEDFMDNLIDWADRTYEKRTSSGREQIPPKKAPFYSISELHMIPPIDDQLYELFAPNLTVSMTPGLNINTMREPLLRALVQDMTEEEVKEFFEFRDADNADNQFKGEEDFFNYLKNKVASFKDNQGAIDKLKEKIRQNNIRLVTDESVFKITVQAQVNQATKLLQAWVQLSSPNKTGVKQPDHGQTATPAAMPSPTPPDAGLKVTFMRIL